VLAIFQEVGGRGRGWGGGLGGGGGGGGGGVGASGIERAEGEEKKSATGERGEGGQERTFRIT